MPRNGLVGAGIVMMLVWGFSTSGPFTSAFAAEAAAAGGSPKILDSAWKEIAAADPPEVRKEHSMVYDPAEDRILMAGEYWGTGDSMRTVTWQYEPRGERWVALDPADPPAARIGPSIAYDPASRQTVLFGGLGFDGRTLGDTWIYDGIANSWRNTTGSVSPSPRSGHTLVYSEQARVLVLFGGRTSFGEVVADTWHFDLATMSWTSIAASASPPARSDYGAGYDPSIGKVVLFGGRNSTLDPLGDLWTYDPATRAWESVEPKGGPAARWGPSLVYHPKSERMILFGGIGRMWEEMGFNDTWALDTHAQSWERLETDSSPTHRFHQAMVYDPVRDRMVLFGGSTGGYSLILGDTWTLEIVTAKAKPTPAPARSSLAPISILLVGTLIVAASFVGARALARSERRKAERSAENQGPPEAMALPAKVPRPARVRFSERGGEQ